jgi:hypothetical protein
MEPRMGEHGDSKGVVARGGGYIQLIWSRLDWKWENHADSCKAKDCPQKRKNKLFKVRIMLE